MSKIISVDRQNKLDDSVLYSEGTSFQDDGELKATIWNENCKKPRKRYFSVEP